VRGCEGPRRQTGINPVINIKKEVSSLEQDRRGGCGARTVILKKGRNHSMKEDLKVPKQGLEGVVKGRGGHPRRNGPRTYGKGVQDRK